MSMYADTVKTGAAAVRRAANKEPLQLLAKLREQDKTGSFEKVVSKWKKIVENDQDYCDAALLYAARNYWTQLERSERPPQASASRPMPSSEELRQIKQEAQARQQATVARVMEEVRHKVLLDIKLSNGKQLRECTGAECLHEGGWLTKIGRKVGKRIVGDVLSEYQVQTLYDA